MISNFWSEKRSFAILFLERKNVPAKDHIMGELIDLKRRRLELEKRKTLALERIALALEMKKKNEKRKFNKYCKCVLSI